MPRTEPIDLAFFDSAPAIYEDQWDINVPVEQFWQGLTGDRPLHWCRLLKIRWTSSRPFGVGTTRHVSVLGTIQADEHFFLWEEGVRFAFHFTRSNLPLFRRFGEYYELKPTSPNTCQFTWKLAGEPTLVGRLGSPLTKAIFTSLFRDTTRYVKILGDQSR